MRPWVLALATILVHSTAAKFSKSFWGLENEALIVRCPRQGRSRYPVDWYYSTNERITTQKRDGVLALGERLKFLPTKVNNSGIYTCILRSSPTSNKTGYVNVTIYKKQPDCNIPDHLMYSTTLGSEKNAKIYCPTIDLYNWTAPIEWFKDCKALQGPRYHTHKTFLLIDNATSKDIGDYTCKFIHNENGINYSVTATRSLTVKGKPANIPCSACFGKGPQIMAGILWKVNKSKVQNFGEPRIHEDQEQNQSSSTELTCMSTVLRIEPVREEDLSLEYACLALNLHGWIRHTIKLKRRSPIDDQSTYYILIGFSILLMVINIMVIMLKVFWIELILLWRDISRPYKTRNDGKIYDAYVIYPRNYTNSPERASAVEYFVHQILPDVLENKCGYNLCIYGRDLLPGEDAATAVEANIRKSRRHIFILTPEITHSREFAYEQEIALHSALIQNDSKVILIELEALSKPCGMQFGKLQDSLKHIVEVQGTIKWREDHVANKRSLNSKFWKHVRYHMPVPSKLSRKASTLASLGTQV
ncbi:interleukin-1 receptor-like 1 isoform X2 [Suricata suricatta]|uniref:Interleukin-1 receptor-like 1 n=1 Tax=Suricata suricatta TaxID=37032 RepID=A0A673TWC4_SURSU|nr:interleukin-1 receptor-like 1 isoform X2 [Suricata suricatta]